MYSLQVAQTAQSGATGSTSVPFVNNAELVFGAGNEFSAGIVGSNPSANTAADATSALQPHADAAAASGNSAIIWVSVAGILVAILLALKKS